MASEKKKSNIFSHFNIFEGSGACPPEDCGGMGGYAEMLQSINMPGHPERESYIEWLGLKPGETWNPYFCSTREVNKRLCLLEG